VKPLTAAAATSTPAREEELVASAQAGNPEAFEALFRRYREPITGYVRASVRDEGRTEDIVQETFFSAHNSLATLGHPRAFRAWLYQIARNACLDDARRRSRNDDLIYGWDEFPPPDERIVIHNQSPDHALSQKEELADLTQAFDGLPASQYEALVLRELEGMSYDEIARRMRLSPGAVESVLFRARRGLKGEYSEIVTGERCKRMQDVMAEVANGIANLGERRKLIRHMRDCSACRRDAAALGLAGLAVPSEERRGLKRALSRVAAFLPLPAFFGRRAEAGEQLSGASSFAAQAQGTAAQLTAVGGDHAVSVVHKAAAVVAAVAVVGGGTVAIQKAGVKLPVKIPVLDSIAAKKDHGKPQETAGPSAGHDRAGGPSGPAPSSGANHPEAAVGGQGSSPAAAPLTTNAPSSAVGSPGTPEATAPGGTAPVDSSPAESGTPPSGGADRPQGDQPTDKVDSGGSTGDGSSKPTHGATDPTTPSQLTTPTGEPVPAGLPPGIQRKLESGALALDDLPPGLQKKLAKNESTSAATTAP
jgi:RNA polymerase sigma factor (sigma-70 family)